MKQRWDKKVYHEGSDFQHEHDEILLSAPASYSMTHDPKHLSFVLARYKFCSKMLEGKKKVMEIGSGDGIGLPIVAKSVGHVYCVDWDERHIHGIEKRLRPYIKNITLFHMDVTEYSPNVKVDAAYLIDVIEHVDPKREKRFLENILRCLPPDGVLIIGTPNISASQYATPCSKVQHINLKSLETLRALMERYFENVFMFGMNDEVIHTGYGPMCHYLWSIAVGLRNQRRKK